MSWVCRVSWNNDDSKTTLMKDTRPKPISFELSRKICVREKSLSAGLSWAHYQNEDEHLVYVNQKQHTLSLYLAGGFQTHRTDVKSDFGAPGRFCLMPKGCESKWQVGTVQQMMHLYFDVQYLKQLALTIDNSSVSNSRSLYGLRI